jgi:AAA+ superfamily predicted ATPase
VRSLRAPEWLVEPLHRLRSGAAHLVVFHGNTDDVHPFGPDYLPLGDGLVELAARRGLAVRYDVGKGLRFPDAEREAAFRRAVGFGSEPLPSAPGPALVLLDAALRSAPPGTAAVVLERAHHVAPPNPAPAERASVALLAGWADAELAGLRPLVALLTPGLSDVAAEVTGAARVEAVAVPRPALHDREEFAARLAELHPMPSWELSPAEFARATGGLTLLQCESVVTRARGRREPLSLPDVAARKLDLLRRDYGDVLEIVEPRGDLSAVGGHAHARRELQEVASLMRSGRRAAVPMGIALMGPPGTGKSHLAGCFAGACGLPCVRFRPLRQMYVGQSERNQERAFEAIRALAPVVVIVDESDQSEGGGRRDGAAGDSGVGERMRGAAFRFWGDDSLRGRVLRIDITNRIDLIDPAMRRSGRTDVKIPILMPDPDERREILEVLVRRLGFAAPGCDLAAYAARAEGFSGSDLELALSTALRFALRDGSAEVLPRHLDQAFQDILPASQDQDAIDRMTLLALDECRNRRLLPARADAVRAEIAARRG